MQNALDSCDVAIIGAGPVRVTKIIEHHAPNDIAERGSDRVSDAASGETQRPQLRRDVKS